MTEKEILEYWKKEQIFQKSTAQGDKDFIFYEGPPSANGRPGIHHCETRAFKDAVCRYKSMSGYKVERKAGWDTQGLPIENQAAKELDLSGKKAIENYGIEKFNQKCREIVWGYKKEWEEVTERFGFWLNMENPYITYSPEYIEKLWEVFKKIYDRKINGESLVYQDNKVVPHCPSCETTLSSHEVAQGYKDITELSAYIKFPLVDEKNTFFLVWTTTPWTLPANVALAVQKNAKYVKTQVNGETYILEQSRANALCFDVIDPKIINGENLVGIKYIPLFQLDKTFLPANEQNFQIYSANFVSTEDGTGIVHIAPAFGEDDFNLGKDKRLSQPLTVDPRGIVIAEVPGKGLFVKEADESIINDLKERNLFFKSEAVTHTYPFCWRCDGPLIYLLKPSWFIAMSKIKDEALANNAKINWVPEFIKNGRFGNFLEELKDWAISREKFWGTPIPIWRCSKCEYLNVIGSFDELKEKSFNKNNFFLLRHGESVANTKGLIVNDLENKNKTTEDTLTAKGIEQAYFAADQLKNEKIDIIFISPSHRTKETAEIISKVNNIEIVEDQRLAEINCGIFNGKNVKDYQAYFKNKEEKLCKAPEGAETFEQVRSRVYAFIREINKKYHNKNILIVSHSDSLKMLIAVMQNITLQDSLKIDYLETGELKKIEYDDLPHDNEGNIDPHRPYIDDVVLSCEKCSSQAYRIPEVIDVWFDSGAMPYASGEYERKRFPADFISEAIDQTRGWFYTLLAISTALNLGPSYQNVITLGLVLDKNGKKMSKSRGNIILPMDIMDKYSADALRWFFYTVNQPAEFKKFNEADIASIQRGYIATWKNLLNFYNTYSSMAAEKGELIELDLWINQKLQDTVNKTVEYMEQYDLVSASRILEQLMDDVSNWYLRRSRKRLTKTFFENLKNVLLTFAQLTAPFTPFIAEDVYQKLNGEKQSVHLCQYPKKNLDINQKILDEMQQIKELAKIALAQRSERGVKVRQPLAKYSLPKKYTFKNELLELLADEINVKNVIVEDIKEPQIDFILTEELKSEGQMMELIRQIQVLRKDERMKPGEPAKIIIAGKIDPFLKEKTTVIEKATYSNINFSQNKIEGKEFDLDGTAIVLQFIR